MVDLDGAKASEPRNLAVLERVATKTALEVQYGGGIKSRGALRSVFGAGASRAICGSIAVREPESFAEWLAEFGGGKLILGADIRDGAVAVQGWTERSEMTAQEADRPIRTAGARAGHLHRHRPRRDAVRHLGGILRWVAGAVPGVEITVSGGIASMTDIEALDGAGLRSVIVGKALYEGRITLEELKRCLPNA